MGAHSHVDQNRAEIARFNEDLDQKRHQIAREVARDARRLAPVDSGDLADSIEWIPGAETDLIVCDAPYWAHVEYGTDPHVIRVRNKKVLRSKEGVFFGKEVNHPGTPAQPFLRPAMFRARAV